MCAGKSVGSGLTKQYGGDAGSRESRRKKRKCGIYRRIETSFFRDWIIQGKSKRLAPENEVNITSKQSWTAWKRQIADGGLAQLPAAEYEASNIKSGSVKEITWGYSVIQNIGMGLMSWAVRVLSVCINGKWTSFQGYGQWTKTIDVSKEQDRKDRCIREWINSHRGNHGVYSTLRDHASEAQEMVGTYSQDNCKWSLKK